MPAERAKRPNTPTGRDAPIAIADKMTRGARERLRFGGVFQGLVGFSAGEMSTVEQVLRGIPVRLAAGNAHMIIAAASISAAMTHLTVDATTGAKIPWNILAATVPLRRRHHERDRTRGGSTQRAHASSLDRAAWQARLATPEHDDTGRPGTTTMAAPAATTTTVRRSASTSAIWVWAAALSVYCC